MVGHSLALGILMFAQEAPAADYRSEVLPILADKCFVCHGPDAETREAGLRLDQGEAAHATGVLDSADSSLVERIGSSSPSLQMPPPDSGLALLPAERDILKRWVADGAPYQSHWAFEPLPADVPVPAATGAWAREELDHFVLARMDAAGLEPSAPAAPERWLRRVTFDLTGLPPTLEELDAFLDDPSPVARESVVDRLLASPAYGEHMAVHWLDVARYADSYGYQADQLSTMWPYRDWVVDAFSAGMPFDQFLVEQLAGDMLPKPDLSQRLATAFNRLHLMTNEGGALEEEWRIESVADRVNTLGKAVFGLSLECARCHDHKYDPITQRDYFSLFAYFNSIDEAGLYMDRERTPTPSLLLPSPAQQAELERLRGMPEDAFPQAPARAPGSTGEVARFPLDQIGPRGRLRNRIDPKNPGKTRPGNSIVREGGPPALRLTGDDGVGFPNLCNSFPPEQPFTLALWVKVPEGLEEGVILHRSTGLGSRYFGMELALRDSRLFFAFKRFWPGNALAVEGAQLPRGRWVHIAATNGGTFSTSEMRLYVDGVEASRSIRNNLTKLPGAGEGNLVLGQRYVDSGLRDALVRDLRVFDRALEPAEVVRMLPPKRRTAPVDPGLNAPAPPSPGEIARRRAILELQTGFVEVPVMEELPTPRITHLLARGAYDAPRTDASRVERRPPETFLAPPQQDGPAQAVPDRLALARWLTEPDHPLTARVAVNRFWAQFFGRGIVTSLDDFGIQGAPPTHPELLDFLAADFVGSGWDVKALCRRIALSATYAQDSAGDRARDPENRYLARGPSGRLSAEALRDNALAAAGLLVAKRGGPPVAPYQPAGLWRESNQMTPAYVQGKGEDLYRRSLYTVWKRTAPMPNMVVFDHAGREYPCARRESTNTPLQALVLLNDVQFVEAARVLAESEVARNQNPRRTIEHLFRRLTSRWPSAKERSILLALHQQQTALFRDDPSAAQALRKTGEQRPTNGLSPVRVAAMTVVAQAVLSMDATVWKR